MSKTTPWSLPNFDTKEKKEDSNVKKTNNDNPIKNCINEYLNTYISWDEKIWDFNQLKKDNKLFQDCLEYFKVNYPEYQKEFSENFKDHFNKESLVLWLQISQIQKSLKDNIVKNYNNFNETLLDNLISNSTLSGLKEISNSKVKLQKFLKDNKIVEDIEKDKKNDDELLSVIFSDKTYEEEAKKNPELLLSIHALCSPDRYINYSDIENIIKSLPNKSLVKNFVKYFLPSITLNEAIKAWIISKEDKNKKIKELLLAEWIAEPEITKQLINTIDTNLITFDLDNNSLEIISSELENIESAKSNFIINKLTDEALNWRIIENQEDEFNKLSIDWFIKKIEESDEISPGIKKNFRINFKEWKIFWWKNWWWFMYFNSIERNKISVSDITTFEWKLKKDYLSKTNKTTSFNFKELYKFLAITTNELNNFWFISNDDIKDNDLEWNELDDINSADSLKKYLDEIDPKNSKIELKDICFLQEKPAEQIEKEKKAEKDKKSKFFNPLKNNIYSVKKVESNWITLSNNQFLTFKEFAQYFKENEIKRQKQVRTVKDLYENIFQSEKLASKFKDLIYDDKDGKIKQKSKDEKWEDKFTELKFLKWKDWKVIKLWKIKNGEFNLNQYIDRENSLDEKNKIVWDLNYMAYYLKQEIEENEMVWDFTWELVEKSKKDWPSTKRHKPNFWTVLWKDYMNLLSFNEIGKWFDMYTNAVKAKLEVNSKSNSAKFAKMLWWTLPESWQITLNQQVLAEQKKLMEWTMTELVSHASKEKIIEHIEKVIFSSKPHYPELEWALMATVKKFWTLYPGKLQKYRKDFLWYKALWWRIWDKLYKEQEAKAKKDNKAFNEEDLIEELLKAQEKEENFKRYWFLRRTDINKNYWNYLKREWINSAYESWEWKATATNFDWRVWIVLWWLKSWEFAEWIWAIEKAIWKAWWAKDINQIIFTLAASWVTKNMPNYLLSKLLIPWRWRNCPYMLFKFCEKPTDLELFDNVIYWIIDSLPLGTSVKAKSDYKNIKSSWWKSPAEKALDFWWKYWDSINDKLILKDPYVFINRNSNPAFKQFINKLAWWYDDAEFSMWKDFINETAIGFEEWYPMWLLNNKLAKSNFSIQATEWVISTKEWKKIFKQFLNEIDNIKKLKSLQEKNKYTDDQLFDVYFELYKKIDLNISWRNKFDPNNPEMWLALKNRCIDITQEPNWAPFSRNTDKYENSKEYENFVRSKFEMFMNKIWTKEVKISTKNKVSQIFEGNLDELYNQKESETKSKNTKKKKNTKKDDDYEDEELFDI